MIDMATDRCWSAESVAQTVFSDIGALAGNADAIFLAAHTPVKLDHRKGPEIDAGLSGEAQVLAALTNRIGDAARNTLIAVTGGSGSGKSHVVRWVNSQVDRTDPRYHVLYVPRAVQTLRELLRRIIEGLPGVEGKELIKRVDTAFENVLVGEFQQRLISEIQLALTWTIENRPPHDDETEDEAAAREDRNATLGAWDDETGRSDGLSELLSLPPFKEALLRKDGRLAQLIRSYFDETSRRDGNDQIFTEEDLPLKVAGRAVGDRKSLQDLWNIIRRDPADALELLEEALRVALPRTVGLHPSGGDSLDSLFTESRRSLRREGRELVLLFEDLVQFGMVDGQLYDQFVTQPGDELAPLRVVFAVTDGAYAKLERTVRTRVEHEFHVGGSVLADPQQFLGRYLNLVRVGREETQRLWNEGRELGETNRWVLNACDTREDGQPCRFRDQCHGAFGSVSIANLGDVGLYPYNAEALRRSIKEAQSEADAEGRPVTPRDVIQLSIEEVLPEADANIAKGEYPHVRTRDQFDFTVRMAKDALLARNPTSDPERTYRALVIWGDEEPLPKGILEAFSINAESAVVPPRPVTPKIQAKQLTNPFLALFQWVNGESLTESEVSAYRLALLDLVKDRLRLDHEFIHIHSGPGKEMLDTIFNRTSFVLEGTTGRSADPAKSVRFELTRKDDTRLLVAARWFHKHGSFETSSSEWEWPDGYNAADLMIELETRLDSWASEVRTQFLNKTGGSRTACHALGIRAIALAAAGHDGLAIHSAADVLSAESLPRGEPSAAWANVAAGARNVLKTLKCEEYIGSFVSVRQGDAGQPQLVDPLELDKAVVAFLKQPADSLTGVIASAMDPVLSLAAQTLLDPLTSNLDEAVTSVRKSLETTLRLLEGHNINTLASAALEVGRTAQERGFFRPKGRWPDFVDAIDFLKKVDWALPEDAISDATLTTLVREQVFIRRVDKIRSSLEIVHLGMVETKREAEREGTGAADVSKLKSSVEEQLRELKRITTSLGSVGGR